MKKEELLKELKIIRSVGEQGIYYHGKIKKYTLGEKVKLLEKCLESVNIAIWELEKTLKVSDIQKEIEKRKRFLDDVNKDNYKAVGYDYYKGESHFKRDKSLLIKSTETRLKELKNSIE